MSTERRVARGPIPPGRPSEAPPSAVIGSTTGCRTRGGRRDPKVPSGREVQDLSNSMNIPAFVATCWTSAGNVAPLDDPEVSPFSAIDRVRAVASTGWAGIGLAQGDLQVIRETVGFSALRAEIEVAGLQHVEVELASGWWRDDLAWRGVWELLLEAAQELRASFIKIGTEFGSPVNDITPFVEPLRRIADEGAAVGTRVAIEPLPLP